MTRAARVEAIRSFNRYYTQRIGVLDEGLLQSPYSLTEVRVLFELAHRDGVEAGAIAADLALDPGYLSRILKRFEREGLLRRSPADADRRRRALALTPKGRRVFAPLDRGSSGQVERMLGALDDDAQQRLVGGMQAIRAALEPAGAHEEVRLRPHQPGDIGWVIERHGALYASEHGYDAEFEALVAGICAKFLENYDPSRERCWIAERAGRRVGCIFLVAKSKAVSQLRMLLLEPSARGLGLGRRLVDECIAFARAAGYRRMVLWTQSHLDDARRIYQKAGFRKTREYRHRSFGRHLVGQIWALDLAAKAH